MKINWADLQVNFSNIDQNRLLESWNWLIGNDKRPILISSIGDLFLADENGICYWLNVGEGILERIAESVEEFKVKLNNNEQVDEWFLIGLVEKLKENGLELRDNHLYGYKKLPVLGGEYEPDNFELTDIEVHFELSGQIHKQIKYLPEGTKVNITTTK